MSEKKHFPLSGRKVSEHCRAVLSSAPSVHRNGSRAPCSCTGTDFNAVKPRSLQMPGGNQEKKNRRVVWARLSLSLYFQTVQQYLLLIYIELLNLNKLKISVNPFRFAIERKWPKWFSFPFWKLENSFEFQIFISTLIFIYTLTLARGKSSRSARNFSVFARHSMSVYTLLQAKLLWIWHLPCSSLCLFLRSCLTVKFKFDVKD